MKQQRNTRQRQLVLDVVRGRTLLWICFRSIIPWISSGETMMYSGWGQQPGSGAVWQM